MSHDNWSARDRAQTDDETELREALTAERARTRRDATLALVDLAKGGLAEETVEALARRVAGDDEADVRQFAVEALGIAGRGSETIKTALDDPEPWVRAEAVVALSRTAEATDRLFEAVEDDSGWVRRNAVIALGKLEAVDQSSLVECIKTDPHPPVREFAAQYLGDVVDDVAEAERILASLLAREANAFVRAKAAESLGQLGTERAEEALAAHGVTDQSEDVARAAKHALAAARGTDPDQLDVEIGTRPAPGSGPDTPGEQAVDGFQPDGSAGPDWSGDSSAPGGAPGFDPRRDLNTDPDSQ